MMVSSQHHGLLEKLKAVGKVWYWCACGQVALVHEEDEVPNLITCHCGAYMILMDRDCLPYWPHYEFS